MNATKHTYAWWFALIVLLLAAVFLRTDRLKTVPPGLTHDEASNGHDSAAILEGEHRIYFASGYGHEPLYNYSVAVTTLLLGPGVFTLRLTTVFWSILTWIFTVALARKWWGRIAALATGAALTVSFWALMMARVGLRAPVLPALLAASALAYAHALSAKPSNRNCWNYIMSGLLLGASFYTYMASRGMPLLYLCFLGFLALIDQKMAKRVWKGTLLVVAVAVLIGLPLFLHLRANPQLETRVGQLAGGITAAQQGDFSTLFRNLGDSLPMLFTRADPEWLYNIADRAALEPLLAVLFTLGLLLAIVRFRDKHNSFTLIWLLGGLAPAFLTDVRYNTLHAIGALPAVFLLIGSGTAWGLRQIRRIDKKAVWYPTVAGAVIILLAITGIGTQTAYFKTWAKNANVNTLYHHHTVTLARLIDEYGIPELPNVIGTQYPGEVHDPYIINQIVEKDDLYIRYADARHALFFPELNARLYLDNELAKDIDYAILDFLQPRIVEAVTLDFPGSHIPNKIEGWSWNAPSSWRILEEIISSDVLVCSDDSVPGTGTSEAQAPLDFGDTVSLVGTRASSSAKVGGTLKIQTVWTIRQSTESDLVLFTHLIDADNNILAQVDRLDAPSWQWQSGDRFVQVHSLDVPDYPVPGTYWLAIGLYDSATLARLPVQGYENVTRLLLPVEITR